MWLTVRQRFNQRLLGQTASWTLAEQTVLLLPNQKKTNGYSGFPEGSLILQFENV